MSRHFKLQLSLCTLRFSIFVVMLMWTLDKFINPTHSAKIFESFYAIPGLQTSIMAMIGGLELALLASFVLGVYKR